MANFLSELHGVRLLTLRRRDRLDALDHALVATLRRSVEAPRLRAMVPAHAISEGSATFHTRRRDAAEVACAR